MKIFTEEFIDILARQVARKLAEQSYRNQLFKENDNRIMVESGCGSTKTTYGGCGSSTVTYDGGCGSTRIIRKPKTTYGGCGSSTVTYNGGCGSGRPSSYGGC